MGTKHRMEEGGAGRAKSKLREPQESNTDLKQKSESRIIPANTEKASRQQTYFFKKNKNLISKCPTRS